jgi:hypothetical protein
MELNDLASKGRRIIFGGGSCAAEQVEYRIPAATAE